MWTMPFTDLIIVPHLSSSQDTSLVFDILHLASGVLTAGGIENFPLARYLHSCDKH